MKTLQRESHTTRPIKVMQFGGGNFLRAYIDWMIDVLNTETNFNGDVLLIKPTEQGDYSTLKGQDGLYHVLTKGIKDGNLIDESYLVKCIQQIVHPYVEWEAYLDTAHIPSIRFIVSNTTESGITFNVADAVTDKPPQEFPAKLTQWLWTRFTYFKGAHDKGCLFLPCELIENNGATLKDCILRYATHWNLDPDFHKWINDACHFSNTLVDRIVTGYPNEGSQKIMNDIGWTDHLLVETEPYHLLVIEGSPIFQDELGFTQTNLNVVFTENLSEYRDIKVKILNGAHTAMVPVSYLAGLRTVKEAIEHSELSQFIQDILFENIIPTLDYPSEQLHTYVKDVIDRFKNPFIKHQLIDISLNSISKFKTRLLPSLLEYENRTGKLPQYIIKALAALIIFYRGLYNGQEVPLRDKKTTIDFFSQIWQKWEDNKVTQINEKTIDLVNTVLKKEEFWGMDLTYIEYLNHQVAENVLLLLSKQTKS